MLHLPQVTLCNDFRHNLLITGKRSCRSAENEKGTRLVEPWCLSIAQQNLARSALCGRRRDSELRVTSEIF